METSEKILSAQMNDANLTELYAILEEDFEAGLVTTQEFKAIEAELDYIESRRG
jgi:hypothetical protein